MRLKPREGLETARRFLAQYLYYHLRMKTQQFGNPPSKSVPKKSIKARSSFSQKPSS